jgi:hypothetical protein
MSPRLFCTSDRAAGARLAALSVASLAIALGLAACTQVAGTSSSTLVRAIDASYVAPAVNVSVAGTIIATNIGQGTFTGYGALNPSGSAAITVTAASGDAALAQTTGTLLAGAQESVFFTDKDPSKHEYAVTLLQDQSTSAPSGQSSFRFLNQALKTGTIDIYMVPSGSTLAKSKPLVTGLAVGSIEDYIAFTSQTVTMVVTAAGSTKAAYTSNPIALTGGEVRTVLILDSALTSNPAVQAVIGNDVN